MNQSRSFLLAESSVKGHASGDQEDKDVGSADKREVEAFKDIGFGVLVPFARIACLFAGIASAISAELHQSDGTVKLWMSEAPV